jgi:AcrR family transcriptional regulator
MARTIAALRTALIELMHEKHYDSITVQDIIDRANVGRSTFYSHFRDKEDLLIGDWKRFFEMIAFHVDLDAGENGRVAPIEPMMTHIKDMHSLYRALERSGKTDRLFAVGTDYLAQKLEEKIRASIDVSKMTVSPEFSAHLLSLQIFGMLKWWLDRNMTVSPAEMGRMFQEFVGPGINNVFANIVSARIDDAENKMGKPALAH